MIGGIKWSIIARIVALGFVAGGLWLYTAAPGWGTPTRTLLLGGFGLLSVLGLVAWGLLGYFAGATPGGKHMIIAALAAVYLGAVVGHLLSGILWGSVDARTIVGAITLGFTDFGEIRSLGATGDPFWIRVVGVLILLGSVAVGAVLGRRRSAMRTGAATA